MKMTNYNVLGIACKRDTFAAASVASALFVFYFGYEILRSANSTMFNEVCGTHRLSLAAAHVHSQFFRAPASSRLLGYLM